MTVALNDRRREYSGNGVATVFNGPMAYASSHLLVFLVDANDIASLVPSSGYEVTGLGRTGGTTVTMDVAPGGDSLLWILRTVPYVQDTDVTNLGAMLPEALEKAYDLLEMQIQQLNDDALQLVFTGTDWAYDFKQHRGINVADPTGQQDVVNLRTLIASIEEGGGGPGAGVQPLKFDFLGDGTTVDFLMDGAQVDSALFYDVSMELTPGERDFLAMEPDQDFIIIDGAGPTERYMRFAVAPADGAEGFAVLRGFARAAVTEYVTSLDIPTFTEATTARLVDQDDNHGRILCTNGSGCDVTIRENTGSPLDMDTGAYFTLVDVGGGGVEVLPESGDVTIRAPAGYLAKTRGVLASITAVCDDRDTNTWTLSGDLLAATVAPEIQSFIVAISDEETELTTGLAKATLRMPYGFVLDEVRASVSIAQVAGSVLTFDINNGGTSILSTKLTIDNGEKSSFTAATPPVFVGAGEILGEDDEISIDIDQVGTALAKGAKITLIGQRA